MDAFQAGHCIICDATLSHAGAGRGGKMCAYCEREADRQASKTINLADALLAQVSGAIHGNNDKYASAASSLRLAAKLALQAADKLEGK